MPQYLEHRVLHIIAFTRERAFFSTRVFFITLGFIVFFALPSNAHAGYPAVASSTSGNSGGNVTSTAISLPGNIQEGDLLLILFVMDGPAAPTATTSGWNTLSVGAGSGDYFASYWKRAVGGGSDSMTITHASEGTAYVTYRIVGANATTGPEVGTLASGTSINPNPPSLNPTNWDVEDTLWIATYGWDANTSHSAYPANFTGNQVTNRYANTQGVGIAAATHASTTASQDPGTATLSASTPWIAQTIAVRPTSPLTISGMLYADEAAVAITSGKTIKAAIGTTSLSLHQTTSNGSGAWTITLPAGQEMATSTPIVVWVDGDPTTRAAVFTKASSTNLTISGLNLYQNRVIIRHEGTVGTSTTIADMSFYDGSDDADIQYYTTGTTSLTVNAGNELHIAEGKAFIPLGEVTVRGNASSGVDGSFHIANSAVYVPGATTTIAGNFIASSSAVVYPNAQGFVMNATTTGKYIYHSTGSTTQTLGSMIFNGSGGGWVFGSANATVTRMTITSGTVTAPTGNLTIQGDFIQNGSFNHNGGTLVATGYNSVFSGTLTDSSPLGHLTLRDRATPSFGAVYDATIDGDGGAVTEIYALEVDTANAVLYAGGTKGVVYRCALTTDCDASGDFTTVLDTVDGAASALVIDPVHKVLYVGFIASAAVYRCPLSTGCDASGDFTASYDTGQYGVRSLTIDPVNGALYVGTASTGNIYRCPLSTGCDASGDFTTAYATGQDEVLSMDVDAANGVLYAGTGGLGIIYRCALYTHCDASGDFTTAYDTSETYIFALTIDVQSGVLYVGTAGSGIIYRCALTTGCDASGDFTTVYDTDEVRIRSFAIDTENQALYAGSGDSGIVYRCFMMTGCDASGDFSVASDTPATNIRSLVSAGGVLFAGTEADGIIYRHVPGGVGSVSFGNAASTTNLTIGTNATVTAPTALTIFGNYNNAGAFSNNGGTLYIASSTGAQTLSGTLTGSSSPHTLILTGTSSKTFSSNASTTNLTIENGATFVAPSVFTLYGNYTNNATATLLGKTFVVASTSIGQYIAGTLAGNSGFGTLRLEGATPKTIYNAASTTHVTIDTGVLLRAPYAMTIAGDLTNNGTFLHRGGILYVASTSNQTLSGNLTGDSGLGNVSLSGSGTKTFSTNASTSQLTIGSGVTVVAPSVLSVQGAFSNSGTFTGDMTSILYVAGASSSVSGTLTGTSAFNTLVISGAPNLYGGSPSTTLLRTGLVDDVTSSTDGAYSIAVDGMYLYVTGVCSCGNKGGLAYRTIKYHKETGDVVWATTTDPSTGTDTAYDIAVDEAYVYVTGLGNGGYYTIAYDKSTAAHVWSTTTSPGSTDYARAVEVDEKYVYVTGYCGGCGTLGADAFYTIAYKKNDGSFVWTRTHDPTASNDRAHALAQDDAYIYVGGVCTGCDSSLVDAYHIVKYHKTTGERVWTVTTDYSAYAFGTEAITGMVTDDVNIYVTGYCSRCQNETSYTAYNTIAYQKTDGALLWSSRENGSVSYFGYGIAADATHVYVTGYCDGCGTAVNGAYHTVKYQKTNGANVWSTTTDIYTGDDIAQGIMQDDSYLYVTGSCASCGAQGGGAAYTARYLKSTGALTTGENTIRFLANASTSQFTIIDNGTTSTNTVYAPSRLSIAGNYSNAGVFAAGSGTTTFNGTSAQTISGTATGTSAFTGLVMTGGGDKTFSTNASTTNLYLESTATTTFSAPLTVSGTLKATTPSAKLALPASATATVAYLELTGTSGNEVRLRSSTPGTKAGLMVNGAYSVTYADIKDSSASSTTGLLDVIGGSNIDSGNNSGWTFTIPVIETAFTVSGVLYSDAGQTTGGAGKSIILYAATGTPSTHATTTGAGGIFSFEIDTNHTIGTSTPLTIYVDGDASLRAVTVTKSASSTANITTLPLYKNRVIVKNESTGATSTTIGDLVRYDNDDDSDIGFRANSGTLEVLAGNELYIYPGTQFYASGTVTVNGNAGTSTDGSLYVGGTYIPAATTTVAGNLYFATTSSYTPNPLGIVLNATTSGKYIHHYQATNTPTLGNLTFSGVGGSWQFGTDNATTSNLTINQYATVTAPLGTLAIQGNFTQNGQFNNNAGTLIADGYESTFSGTLSGTSSLATLALRDGAAGSFGTAYDTSETRIRALVIDTANRVLYAGTNAGGIIYRCALSTGCDASGDFTTAYDTSQSDIRSLVIDSINGTLYAGSGSGGIIYRCALSTGCDASGDFTTAYDTTESYIGSLAIDGVNGFLYAGTESGGFVYRCALSTGCDASDDFIIATMTLDFTVDAIAIDEKSGLLFLTSYNDGKIYRCTLATGCGNLSAVYDTTESYIYSLAIDAHNGVLYAGTDPSGIIYRCALSTGCDASGDFTTAYDTSASSVYSLTIDTKNGILYAGTGANSAIYRCALSTGCDASSDFTLAASVPDLYVYSLVSDPKEGVLYAGSGTGGGIYRYAPSGVDSVTFSANASTSNFTVGTYATATMAAGTSLEVEGVFRNAGAFGARDSTLYLTGASTTLTGTLTGSSALNDVTISGIARFGTTSSSTLYGAAIADPTSTDDLSYGITQDDAYIYVTGSSQTNTTLHTVKYRKSTGERVWATTTDPVTAQADLAYAIAQDTDNVYVTGTCNGCGGVGSYALYTIAYRKSDASRVWVATSDPTASGDRAQDIYVDRDSVYVTGYCTGCGSLGGLAFYTVRYAKSDGSMVWATTTDPTASSDEARGISGDQNHIYVTGGCTSCGPLGAGSGYTIAYAKSNGSMIWATATDAIAGADSAYDNTSDEDAVYTVGFSNDGTVGGYGYRIFKLLKSTGERVWTVKTDPASSNDIAFAVAVDGEHIYVTGECDNCGSLGGGGLHIVKYLKSTGVSVWSVTTDVASSSDYAEDIIVDDTYVYATGMCTGCGTTGGQAYYTAKYLKSTGALVSGNNTATFAANASTTDLYIANGGANATNTLIAPTGSLTVAGNYTNYGMFTHSSGTVYFASSSRQALAGSMATSSPFNNAVFSGSGVKSFADMFSVATDTPARTIYSIAIDAANGVLYAGTGLGGVIYRCVLSTGCDASGDFTTAYDTSETYINVLTIDAINGILFAGSGSDGIIYRCVLSTGCDASGDFTTAYDTSEFDINALTIDTTNGILFAGSGDSGIIYRCALSTGCDASGDFTTAYDTTSSVIYFIAIDTTNGILFAGSGDSGIIYRCVLSTGCDASGDFTTAYDTSEFYIQTLAVDTTNGVLYAGGGGSNGIIYRCALSTGCDASGDFTTAYDTTASSINSITIDFTSGILFAGSGNNGIIYRCATGSGCYVPTNVLTFNNLTTESGTTLITPEAVTVRGSYTQNGTTTATSTNTFFFTGNSAQTLTGTLVGTSSLPNIVFSGAGTKTFASQASSSGNFMIDSGATVVAPSALTLRGNYANAGTFSHNAGMVYLASTTASQRLSGTLTGSSAFNAVTMIGGTSTVATSSGLVGKWMFEEGTGSTTRDASGGTSTAAMNGAPTWINGKIGGGVQFDGVDDSFITATSVTASAHTFAAWINVDSVSGNKIIMTHGRGAGPHAFFYVENAGLLWSWSGGDSFHRTNALSLSPNTWYHVAATYDGTASAAVTNVRIYVNGVSQTLADSTEPIAYAGGTKEVHIGKYYDGTMPFAGKMDDVRVYNRELSATEVFRLYAEQPKVFSGNASTTDLVVDTTSLSLPAYLSIAGNVTTNGGVIHNAGTTTFSGTSPQTISGSSVESSAWNTLVMQGAGTKTFSSNASTTNVYLETTATTTFSAPLTVSGTLKAATPSAKLALPASATATVAYLELTGTSGNEVRLRSSTPGTKAGLLITGTTSVTYADVQDSSGSTTDGSLIDPGEGSVNSGNNSGWLFLEAEPGNATLSGGAHQTFALNYPTTTISTITVTDATTPSITTTSDLRIVIATSTVNMRWDTTDTQATFGGTAGSKVSNTVSYENNGATLVITVTENFAASDTLTIDNLSFAQFLSTTTAASALGISVAGNATGTTPTDDKTVTITGSLTATNHTEDQIGDNFQFPIDTGVTLFRYILTPAGEQMTVSTTVFTLSGVSGVNQEDLSNFALYRDIDQNGEYSAGDTQIGGAGVLAISGQTGTITFSTTYTATTSLNYILIGDIANIRPGDMLTISLDPTDLEVGGNQTFGTVPPVGIVSRVQHMKNGMGSSGGGPIGGDAPAGQSVETGGTNQGGGEIDTNTNGDILGDLPNFRAPGGQAGSWTSGASGINSDGVYASASVLDTQHTFTGLGLSIPSNNTITGIEVKLEGSGTTDAGEIEVAITWNDGSNVTTAKTTGTLTTTDRVYTLGSPADTWGRGWTPAELAGASIRITAKPSSNAVRLDAIRIRVYHQATGGGQGGGSEVRRPPQYGDQYFAYAPRGMVAGVATTRTEDMHAALAYARAVLEVLQENVGR